MIFVPRRNIVSIDSDSFAKAVWDEKERRDKIAKGIIEAACMRRRKQRTIKKLYKELGEALIKGEEI